MHCQYCGQRIYKNKLGNWGVPTITKRGGKGHMVVCNSRSQQNDELLWHEPDPLSEMVLEAMDE